MVQKTVVELIDDIDGGAAHRTHRIVVDGRVVDIDLSDANWALFVAAVEPFLRHGRRVGAGRGGVSVAERRELSARQRKWAAEHGYVVSPRGRVPAAVRAAFHQSQQSAV